MPQSLHPLYGENIDDFAIAKAINLPSGVYEGFEPSIAGAGGSAGWTVTLGVDSVSGRSLWRTKGDLGHGRYVVEEIEPIQLHIAGPSAASRVDLIVGLHKWVAGPIDSNTLLPTGDFTVDQRASYVVVQGASGGGEPAVPDPYSSGGTRAVVLAKVLVSSSGSATVLRYSKTDLRLDFMRSVVEDVLQSRLNYPTLLERLSTIKTATQIESLYFRGSTTNTGSKNFMTRYYPDQTKKYGSAVEYANNTFVLNKPGLYEILALHKIEGVDDSENTLLCYLVHDGGGPQLIDSQGDTNKIETTSSLYAQVYVDESWTNTYVYIERGGLPAGYMRGSVKYLGTPLTVDPLAIGNTDTVLNEAADQAYPDSAYLNLSAINPVGAVTWAVGAGGTVNGASEPKAEIANGNQLKITFGSRPGTFPWNGTVVLIVTDSANRTVSKQIGVTLNGPLPLSITTSTPMQITIAQSMFPARITLQPIAVGGKAPYTWSIVSTTLPEATYDASSNPPVFRLMFTSFGTFSLRIRCTDAAGTQVEKDLSIVIVQPPSGGGITPQ